MTEVVFLFAEITHASRASRASASPTPSAPAAPASTPTPKRDRAGPLIGEDPNDIADLDTKLVWAGASVGRSGMATQAIAAIDIALYDLKAKRAGLPLAKLLGAHRDSVALLQHLGRLPERAASRRSMENARAGRSNAGIGGIKIKVGLPDTPHRPAPRRRRSASTSAATCR